MQKLGDQSSFEIRKLWFGRPGKPLHPPECLVMSVVQSGGNLCKLSLCASKQMDEGSPTTCQAVGVYKRLRKRVCSWFCAFLINMWVLDMPSTMVLFFQWTGGDSRERRAAQSCLHTLDESQPPFSLSLHKRPLFHLCVWTQLPRRRWRMTTSCLGLFISDWLRHVY